MLKFYLIIYFVNMVYAQNCFVETNVTSGTDILLSFVVHRHGERMPVESQLQLLNISKTQFLKKYYPYKLGDLINKGKRTGYCIGKILRQRYRELISDIYFEKEILIVPSSVTRTKMTALCAMAGLYPPTPQSKWNTKLDWQPVPYSQELEYDYFEFFKNCPYFMKEFGLSAIPELKPYSELITYLENRTGADFRHKPINLAQLNDMFSILDALEEELPQWAHSIRSKLADAALVVYNSVFNKNKIKRLTGGVFFNKFLSAAADVIAGVKVPQPVRIFSAHDLTVYAAMTAAGVPRSIVKFGGFFAIELHKVRETDEYVVFPFYVPSPGVDSAKVLPIAGCSSDYCDFYEFQSFVDPYTLTEEQQRVECNTGI